MRSRTKVPMCVVSLLLTIVACRAAEARPDPPEGSEATQRAVEPIDCDFRFALHDEFYAAPAEPGTAVTLSVASRGRFERPYEITHTIAEHPCSTVVSFVGMRRPWFWPIVGNVPASTIVRLPWADGKRLLVFRCDDLVDRYDVTVTESTIVVGADVAAFTEPDHDLYWRRRADTFVLRCGSWKDIEFPCDELARRLEEAGQFVVHEVSAPRESAYPILPDRQELRERTWIVHFDSPADTAVAEGLLMDLWQSNRDLTREAWAWIMYWRGNTFGPR